MCGVLRVWLWCGCVVMVWVCIVVVVVSGRTYITCGLHAWLWRRFVVATGGGGWYLGSRCGVVVMVALLVVVVVVLVIFVVWVCNCGSKMELFGDWIGDCDFGYPSFRCVTLCTDKCNGVCL